MTLIKKDTKDDEMNKETQNFETEENTEETANVDKKTKAKADKKAEKKAKGGEKLSSEDFMKACLSQALEKAKKAEAENEKLKAENEHLNNVVAQAKEKLESIDKEYENYRRRTTLEKESLGTEATCKAVKALLPPLDNLERAVPFAESNPESFVKGVKMTLNQMTEAFKSLGVEEIEAEGKEFDANLHDVVMHEENEEMGDSIVTQVFQKGYKLGDKVIRHSAVKVVN